MVKALKDYFKRKGKSFIQRKGRGVAFVEMAKSAFDIYGMDMPEIRYRRKRKNDRTPTIS